MKICVNTFGLGRALHNAPEAVWGGLLQAGVTGIEPCIALRPIPLPARVFTGGLLDGVFPKEKGAALIEDLRRRGLEVYCFHLHNTPFRTAELKKALRFMKENELDTCVYSFMTGSVKKIRALAPVITEAVAMLRAEGKELLIHNHDMEWREEEGTSVMRWLLQNVPELRFELDLGWTQYAGVDPVKLLREYPDRFPLLHFKEIAKGAKAHTRKPFCTAPGEGILPLEEILTAAKELPLTERAFIIDQDDSVGGDIVADVARGIGNLRRLYR